MCVCAGTHNSNEMANCPDPWWVSSVLYYMSTLLAYWALVNTPLVVMLRLFNKFNNNNISQPHYYKVSVMYFPTIRSYWSSIHISIFIYIMDWWAFHPSCAGCHTHPTYSECATVDLAAWVQSVPCWWINKNILLLTSYQAPYFCAQARKYYTQNKKGYCP